MRLIRVLQNNIAEPEGNLGCNTFKQDSDQNQGKRAEEETQVSR